MKVPNVVKSFGLYFDDDYVYQPLELCETSLAKCMHVMSFLDGNGGPTAAAWKVCLVLLCRLTGLSVIPHTNTHPCKACMGVGAYAA